MQQIKAGWRDEGLEEAVAIVSAMPEINAVLERESALLAQNLVSGIASATHENEVAARANKATKEALCRSFLVGLQGGRKSAFEEAARAVGNMTWHGAEGVQAISEAEKVIRARLVSTGEQTK